MWASPPTAGFPTIYLIFVGRFLYSTGARNAPLRKLFHGRCFGIRGRTECASTKIFRRCEWNWTDARRAPLWKLFHGRCLRIRGRTECAPTKIFRRREWNWTDAQRAPLRKLFHGRCLRIRGRTECAPTEMFRRHEWNWTDAQRAPLRIGNVKYMSGAMWASPPTECSGNHTRI